MFFAILVRESDNFHKQKDNRTAPASCIYAVGMLYTNMLLYTGVGHCFVCFLLGFCQNLLTDKRESTPHFLVFV